MRVSPRRIAFVLSLSLVLLAAGCSNESSQSLVTPGEISTTTISKAAPAGYYDTADETSSATLRSSLHGIIDDHTRVP